MLKRDGFQPSGPTLFNVALSCVSASLSQQARSSSAGASFVQAKRRESLLMHTSIPVPEAQRRSLTVAPGSGTGRRLGSALFADFLEPGRVSFVGAGEVSTFLLLSACGSFRLGSSSCWPAIQKALCLLLSFQRAHAL